MYPRILLLPVRVIVSMPAFKTDKSNTRDHNSLHSKLLVLNICFMKCNSAFTSKKKKKHIVFMHAVLNWTRNHRFSWYGNTYVPKYPVCIFPPLSLDRYLINSGVTPKLSLGTCIHASSFTFSSNW